MDALPRHTDRRCGATLFVVMGMTLLGMLAAGSILAGSLARMRQADRQVCLEQAFYLAAAGAERAATHVAAGHEKSTTLTGTLGKGRFEVVVECQPLSGGDLSVDVISEGTVKNVSRKVSLRGIRRVSWARYALWYDSEVTKLWIVPGERFDGRVYSKPQLHFHNKDLAANGQARFTDKVWTCASTIEKASAAVNPIFERGLTTSAEAESMSSVDFADLRSKAVSDGLVLDGATAITLNGSMLRITNSRLGWSNKPVAIPDNGLVYVRSVTSGSSSTRAGNLSVAGQGGLDGRVTLVAENDIRITDHVRYANNPAADALSDDALGLIAKRNVVVQTSAPDNLDIYAHIICQDGGFGVDNYDSGSSRGVLTVYGGIVNKVRNAVGIVGGSGFTKNYIFDTRFSKNPPPSYPKLIDELEWTEWEG